LSASRASVPSAEPVTEALAVVPDAAGTVRAVASSAGSSLSGSPAARPSGQASVQASVPREESRASAARGAASGLTSAARRAARRGADAVGDGVRRARDAVAEEIEADLAGENLPGGVRRRRKQDPEDRQRRLIERTALEGAIRDPGEGYLPRDEAAPPRPTAPVAARSLSTRVLALVLILIVSGFMLFPAVTTYARQRDELRAAQDQLAQEQATQEQLKEQLARWDDPNYVRQQARERIQRFLPGEKRYVVIGAPEQSGDTNATTVRPDEYRQGLPWGDGLWDTVVRTSTP